MILTSWASLTPNRPIPFSERRRLFKLRMALATNARVGVERQHVVIDLTFARLDVFSARLHLTISGGNIQIYVACIGQADEQHARLLFLQSKEIGVLL